MTETARTLADDILKAAGSALRHYEAASQDRIVAVAQRWIDEATPKWRPIEEIDVKEGERFFGAEPDGNGWVIGTCVWCKTPHVPLYGFHFTEGDPEDWNMCKPTRWMPLPAHPALTQGEEA